MTNFEFRKQLKIEDFNSYGKKIIEEHNIDKNKDRVIQGSELNTLFEKVGGGNYGDPNEPYKIAGDISRLLATESSGMQNTSRVTTKEGQAAIENFNNMTSDEKGEILEKYSNVLREKAAILHENYERITTNNDDMKIRMNMLDKLLKEQYALLLEGKDNTSETDELSSFIETFQKELEQSLKSLDGQLADALIEFGGKDIFGNHGSPTTNIANTAISKVNALKQDIKASFENLQSLAYAIISETGDNNREKINNYFAVILEKFEQLQKRFNNGCEEVENNLKAIEHSTLTTLNYIENNQVEDYANNGIPSNLDMENKVAEGVLMDILMDANQSSNTAGINNLENTSSQKAPIFDLSGRQVSGELQKGQIYIQNGKKFVAQ